MAILKQSKCTKYQILHQPHVTATDAEDNFIIPCFTDN